MECRGILDDDGCSGSDHVTDQLWNPASQIKIITTEVHKKRSLFEKTEARGKLKYQNRDIQKIPPESHFPEYEQLHRIICRNPVCESIVILRIIVAISPVSFPDGDTGKYAGKIPVYAGSTDGCSEWKQA